MSAWSVADEIDLMEGGGDGIFMCWVGWPLNATREEEEDEEEEADEEEEEDKDGEAEEE